MLFQELLQNAEDAGAQRVQFLYDKNSYAETKLHSSDMAPFQVSCLLERLSSTVDNCRYEGQTILISPGQL